MSTPNPIQELLNKAFELLEKKLEPAKLASTGIDGRGNGFRLTEYYATKCKGQGSMTPDALAEIFYEAVVKDVNDEVNGGQRGQLKWTVLPKKLAAHYKALGREVVHPIESAQKPRQEKVSPEAQQEAKREIEQLCKRAGLHELTSRAATIHRFVQEQIESGADLTRAIPMVKKFLAADLKNAMQILNEYRAGGSFDFTGGSFYSGQGFSSGGRAR